MCTFVLNYIVSMLCVVILYVFKLHNTRIYLILIIFYTYVFDSVWALSYAMTIHTNDAQ